MPCAMAALVGQQHTIYKSAPKKAKDKVYLRSNSWTEKPSAGVNNYIVSDPPFGFRKWSD